MNLTQHTNTKKATNVGRPVQKTHKTKFGTRTAHMKYACRELELFRILNYELKYELNPTY